MMEMPKPIYVVHEEGGEFVKFENLHDHLEAKIDAGGTCTREQYNYNYRVHAIYFADGSQFDVLNGWRKPSPRLKPIVRVKMGRSIVQA